MGVNRSCRVLTDECSSCRVLSSGVTIVACSRQALLRSVNSRALALTPANSCLLPSKNNIPSDQREKGGRCQDKTYEYRACDQCSEPNVQ